MNHLVTCLKCDTRLEIERIVNIAHVKQRLVQKQSFLECAGGKRMSSIPCPGCRSLVMRPASGLPTGQPVWVQTFVAGSQTLST